MSTLLIGYDVECGHDPEITRRFLRKAQEVHLEHPCTLFLVGQVIENNLRDLEALAGNPMFDLQQHTYSHRLLKSVCIDQGDGKIQFIAGMPLAEIEDEVGRASDLIRRHFGRECTGITGPWAYYRGLSDRPDILEVLHRLGIRFTRTYGRDHHDFQPVSFSIQPFRYEAQGFPEILEFPIHGWQDVYWREINGWANLEGYSRHLRACLKHVAGHKLVWSYGSHDWSSIRDDPEMSIIRSLIRGAERHGAKIMSYLEYSEANR